ncbi:hypothetical protein AB0J86_20170 [Micromonospora sp. NPDC049559]|uniref:hypothetical protein n=1 Tax=Micromonospora sp. NPDC049559 TaxID=3155923 RepID=UPI003435BD03
MQRARRLASIAVIAALGAVALTGCRSNPSTAAYVAGHSYSQDYVDGIMDEVEPLARPEMLAGIRQDVVRMLVVRDVARGYAERHNISVPSVDANAFAQENNLPPNLQYTEVVAGYEGVLRAIQQSAASVAPSEADQREVFAHITVGGRPVSGSFEDVREFLNEQQIGRAVGLRNALREAIEQADVTVNPRYGDLVFQVPVSIQQQAQSWLGVPLGDDDGLVSEVTVVQPAQPSPQQPE